MRVKQSIQEKGGKKKKKTREKVQGEVGKETDQSIAGFVIPLCNSYKEFSVNNESDV